MIRCIIVDDEPLAQDVIKKYIEQVPWLSFEGSFDSAIDTLKFLKSSEQNIDLIFLDINMPELSGFNMLKVLKKQIDVIVTTAFSEYALESYNYSVIDYLLKPIEFHRFLMAVEKKAEKDFRGSETKLNGFTNADDILFFNQDKIIYKIAKVDIRYIHSYGNYLKIHTKDKMYIIRNTIKNIMLQLPDTKFIKVHKSYIVAISEIKKIDGKGVSLGDIIIPIGKMYRLNLQNISLSNDNKFYKL